MWVDICLEAHTSLTIFILFSFCFFNNINEVCGFLYTGSILVHEGSCSFLCFIFIACFDLFAFLLNDFEHSIFAFHWHAVDRRRVEWIASHFVVLGFTRQTYLLLYNQERERSILSCL